jgi:hypothetical protein
MITKQINEYNSSTVLASSYDYSTNELDVLFENGAYRYIDVPAGIYHQFSTADSQGAALNQFIKGGQFYCVKLQDEETTLDEFYANENDGDESQLDAPHNHD